MRIFFAICLAASFLFPAFTAKAELVQNARYPFNFLIPNDMHSRPKVSGTQYDCKIRIAEDGKPNVYQAFVSGRFYDPSRPISSVACFQSANMCQRYLYFMRGYLDYTLSATCQRGYASLF
ncbi:hypothetical protein [Flexibacterium corallicola]|uniref:hypothetical protein n=1 Tax=Flexibacterium corallicola TaxID=3037259 RepID=UPI00286F6389|nr:hypothetical protein [Pseudovibrio sp. M1P-2-3]